MEQQCSRKRRLVARAVLALVVMGSIVSRAMAQDDPLSHIVGPDFLGPPVVWAPDAIGSGLWAKRVAHGAQVPVIFEAAPAGPGGAVTPVRVDLSGLTVREAIDRLVTHDPRYTWQVVDGAVVIRPGPAWNDEGHPFNGPASRVQSDDTIPLAEALRQAVSGDPLPSAMLETSGQADRGRRVPRSAVSRDTVLTRISTVSVAGGYFVEIRDPRTTPELAVKVSTGDGLGYGVAVPQPSKEQPSTERPSKEVGR